MRTGIKNKLVRKYGDALAALPTEIVGESMTRQDMAEACNINVIYAKTQRGEIVLSSNVMPEFGDFTQLDSYDVALEKIMEAEEAFASLPAKVRRLYNDDPKTYYDKMLEEAQGKYDAKAAEEAAQSKKKAQEQAKADARELLKDEIKQEE